MTDISLLIYCGVGGGPISSAPVVRVGDTPEKALPIVPQLVHEHNVWMISHTQDYTLYSLYTKEFKGAGGCEGQCLFNLYINSRMKLTDGNSAMTVLTQLKEAFSVQGLIGGELPSMPVDSMPFDRILSRYRVVERSTFLPVMHGSTPASYRLRNQMELDAMMRFSRYQELSNISTLELGMSCESTIAFMNKNDKPQPKPHVRKPVTPVYPPNVPVTGASPKTQTKERKSGGKMKWLVAVAAAILLFYIIGNSHKTEAEEEIIADNDSSIVVPEDATEDVSENVPTASPQISEDNNEVSDVAQSEVTPSPIAKPNEDATPEVTKEEAIKKVLELIHRDDYAAYNSPAFSAFKAKFSRQEKVTIEAVLNYRQFRDQGTTVFKKITQAVAMGRPYKTWDDVRYKAMEINKIITTEDDRKRNAPVSGNSPSAATTPSAPVPTQPATNTAWMNSVKSYANSCPINYTYEIHVTQIDVSQTSVTLTVKYLAVSKYELTSNLEKEITTEITEILRKYCREVPSSVKKIVNVVDKSGRSMLSKVY